MSGNDCSRRLLAFLRRDGTWSAAGWLGSHAASSFIGRSRRRPVRGEGAIGWAFHYAVGIVYAALYLAIMRLGFHSGPSLISALSFAIALLAAPWLILLPALGMGFFAARMPHPAAVRVVNVSVHAVFGLGLYLGAYSVTTADGKSTFFLESDLRFKIDSSNLGPDNCKPVIAPAGTEGDRVWVTFSSPDEVSRFVKRRRS
jgi:hypothetical protein